MRHVAPLLLLAACSTESMTAPSLDEATDPYVTMIGAGDVHAKCRPDHGSFATANLVAQSPEALVYTLGDNAGIHGTAAEYGCFNQSWGRFTNRMDLAMGNHERNLDRTAKAYYDYGADHGVTTGDRGKGYYAFTYGTWRILVLNSEQALDEQPAFIAKDLAEHPAKCQLAMWHKPLFTSGAMTPVARMRTLWKALYDAKADVILNAHDHTYQRYQPTDIWGKADSQGIREFIVGTGGGVQGHFETSPATIEQRFVAFGVLKLKLYADSYRWEFIDTAGNVRDSGSANCH